MSKDFYKSAEYRAKQSAITRAQWRLGKFEVIRKIEVRRCLRSECINDFSVQQSNPKKFCSRRCAALVNSPGRHHDVSTKLRISTSLTGRKYPNRPKEPPRFSLCLYCWKEFKWRYWRAAANPIKYCSVSCLMKDVGSRPTSPRAARAKAGIRPDLGDCYFFSRWEANYARVLNFLGKKWIFQPKIFRLTNQNYTPDFYLPEDDTYIEIKNFLSDYSAKRDSEFRKLYPGLKLKLILKDEYLVIQKRFASKIKTWEYS